MFSPYSQQLFHESSHLLIEGELSYGEFDRRIESETGLSQVQWRVPEIVDYLRGKICSEGVSGSIGGHGAERPFRRHPTLIYCNADVDSPT